ncbi:IS607 family transposase [Rhodococcus jostii]|uniref:IS607 family transposase n=1 Tax=Rhodococcus jostii TaxID=132919 RepID=UPI0036420DEE
MRIGEAAEYLGMSVVGVRKAASEGRLPSRRTGSGHRIFDRADLDSYLGRPASACAGASPGRVEALYCRVSGSTGQEASLANQEKVLRESATGEVGRVYKDRGSGLRERRAGLDRMLDDAAKGRFTVVRVVWRDRLARFGVAWMERYLSQVGVTVEVLRDKGDRSLVEELMDDFMALLASFSGQFYQLRSKQNQHRLLDDAAARLGRGNR